jgi:hypothetical protein
LLDHPINHRVLPRVLIWALLLCHGAFGALHVAADPAFAAAAPAALSATEHATAHHTSEHHDGTGQEERQADHAASEYFAVLLGSFFGGLALWGLLRNAPRRRGTSFAARRSWATRPEVFSLPRGPTLPRLQVFRL